MIIIIKIIGKEEKLRDNKNMLYISCNQSSNSKE